MKRIAGASLLALILVALCIQGARWQFDRHEFRHAKNELIRANIVKDDLTEPQLSQLSLNEIAWRTVRMDGRCIPTAELLLRNRYHQGKYGFGVITLFESNSGKKYWINILATNNHHCHHGLRLLLTINVPNV